MGDGWQQVTAKRVSPRRWHLSPDALTPPYHCWHGKTADGSPSPESAVFQHLYADRVPPTRHSVGVIGEKIKHRPGTFCMQVRCNNSGVMPYGWGETELVSWPVSGQCQLAGAMPGGGWQLSMIVSCTERRWQLAEPTGLQRWQPPASPRKRTKQRLDEMLTAATPRQPQYCLEMVCVFLAVIWGSPFLTENE